MSLVDTPARAIVRIVLIIVGVIVALGLIYLLRKPISWLLIATFLAVALSAPVNVLGQRMRRGFAITIVYVAMLLVPIAIGALIVPTLVEQADNLANDLPGYVRDLQNTVDDNERLRDLNEKYQVTVKLQQEAERLPDKLGGAAGALRDVGIGIVNSIFAMVTILVLTAFMLGGGRSWIDAGLRMQPPDRAARLRRVLERSSRAVGGYVAGAIAQAALAAVLAYIVLAILGVPFKAPLAVLIFFFDLIPLVGATIAAVLVGVVTAFTDFPTATIIWAVWSIVYQQVENTVIQPRIQQRAVEIHPFLVLVAVLFGSTLLGIIGALVAIPVAASIQIAVREWWAWSQETAIAEGRLEGPAPPPPPGGPAAPGGGPGPAEAPA